MRDEKLKPSYLINELKSIKNELRKVSMLVESRVIGLETPTREDADAIKEFGFDLINAQMSDMIPCHFLQYIKQFKT